MNEVDGMRQEDNKKNQTPTRPCVADTTLKELHWLPIKQRGRLQTVPPCAQSDGWSCAILPDWYAAVDFWVSLELGTRLRPGYLVQVLGAIHKLQINKMMQK